MTSSSKNRLTTIALVLAMIQGPFFYYFTEGFIKMILMFPYAIIGLIVIIDLLSAIIKHRTSNSWYHIVGFGVALGLGVATVSPYTMEHIDFKIFLSQRNKIVEQIKDGTLRMGNGVNRNFGSITLHTWMPLSKGDNTIRADMSDKGVGSVEFYIDRGFIDHYSAFLYTNNPDEMKSLDKGSPPGPFGGTAIKLADNWYRVGY